MTSGPTLRFAKQNIQVSGSLLMGVVNASVNSFSDAGQYRTLNDRVDLADRLIAEGADIIDVGGQSLVSGEPETPAEDEIALVVPIVSSIADRHPEVLISVDTYKPQVAEAAVEAGAAIVNDVSGLLYPDLARVCAASGSALVISHTRNKPKERLVEAIAYDDVVADVLLFLSEKMDQATNLGVPMDALILDPGPDFAKTPAQTIEVIRRVEELRRFGRPLLLALSRKDFLGAIVEKTPRGRDAGTMAAIAMVAATPGNIFRVHDVAACRDVLKVVDVLSGRVDVPDDYRLPEELRREPSVS